MNKRIFSGFSLTEVLIAVAIIGIIAAITIPTVIQNHTKKSFSLLLQKNYVELQENLTILQTENYNSNLYDSILISNTETFIKEYYKVSKYCGSSSSSCFASSYRTISNSNTSTSFSCNGYNAILASGAAICMIPTTPVTVYLDVNGKQDPNIGGRDMFTFNIYKDFMIDEVDPEGSSLDSARETLYNNNCLTSYVGKGCFGHLLNNNWQMDY